MVYFATEAARFWQPPVMAHGGGVPPLPTATPDSFLHPFALSAVTTATTAQQDATADTFLVLGASLFLSRVARAVWRAPMLAVADQLLSAGAGSDGSGSGGVSGGLKSLFYTLVTTAIAKASSSGASGKDSTIVGCY